jgi:hypothetical protein
VLRGDDAVSHARSTTDSTPFLVGGWLTAMVSGGASKPCPSSGCGDTTRIADRAGTVDTQLDQQIEFRLLSEIGPIPSGPAVVQVHTHDEPVTCGGSPECDGPMIADALIWTGDAQTEARPLTLGAVTGAITETFPGTAFQAIGSPIVDCGAQLPAAQLLVTVPPPD